MGEKQRIAILGGGMGAMAAAWGLTGSAALRERYEVTIYQMGWRLGGKGASGRNQEAGHRIEEHGLHVFMGWYENTFRILRECYAELGRAPGQPLATWREAFQPHDYVVLMDQEEGEWTPWVLDFPRNADEPGDGGGELPSTWAYVQLLLGWADRLLSRVRSTRRLAIGDRAPTAALHYAFRRSLSATRTDLGIIGGALDELRGWLGAKVTDWLGDSSRRRRMWIMLDLALTTARGLIAEGVADPAFRWDALDDRDLRQWLAQHGAHRLACESALVRGFYDLGFATEGGIAAGTAINGILRMCLTYKGAIFWKMQAGMGDVVFAPFYQALRARGVRFRFFHRVERLEVGDDGAGGARIAAVHIGRQATLRDGDYQPLIDVDGLPCWPSQPRFEQLVEGDEVRRGGHDLESFWDDWPDAERLVLRAGQDYDQVVLGISIGAFPAICGELAASSPAFAAMVERVATTQTQAAQLWFNRDLAGLGWQLPAPVLDGFVHPFDSWADMSHLLGAERWGTSGWGGEPRSLAYLCSRLDDDEPPPPRSDRGYPARQAQRVRDAVGAWLEDQSLHLWPDARTDGPSGRRFDCDTLHAPANASGRARLDAQHWHANCSPSERYVLSVPGSTAYRLRADEAGFSNLVMAGDWLYTGMNAGCAEAATMGGLQAARALCGEPAVIVGDAPRRPTLRRVEAAQVGPGDPFAGPDAGRRQGELPPFIRRGGDLVMRAPLAMRQTTTYSFVLDADRNALQHLCDRYLNEPAAGAAHYRPLGPFVSFVAAYAERGQSTALPDRDLGWLDETDIAFWVPLLARDRDGDRGDRLVWFMPYVWVDNPAAVATGREIYGFPKALGRLHMPRLGEEGEITVDALVIPHFGREQQAQSRTLVRAAPVEGPGLWSRLERWLGRVLPWDVIREHAGAAADSLVGVTIGAVDDLIRIFAPYEEGVIRFAFLKQFPDVADSSRACYQAVVEAAATVQEWHGGGVLPPHRLTISAADSHPIVRELGLPSATPTSRFGFWLRYDFTMEEGCEIGGR